MYLKRVTVAGFKSFAGTSVLSLEPGITAVVGPNGSGKSNLADAVRWALGEQSKARLRLGERDEVVFVGNDKKLKASFAEVTLLFDNQDGAFPLELTEVEISRRLYRSGETDYRLAGRTVRLADIQHLLAEAGFGTNTYAVIGQGMIDSFLLSSPAERKLLFDEAAGIRGSELKREAAGRKLAATEANLVRLRDIMAELEPRLASLGRAAAAAERQRGLDDNLAKAQAQLAAATEAAQAERDHRLTAERDELTLQLKRLNHEMAQLNADQTAQLAAANRAESARAEHQAKLAVLETTYDQALAGLAQARAEASAQDDATTRHQELTKRSHKLAAELAKAQARLADTEEQLVTNQAASDRADKALERIGQDVASAQAELVAIRRSTVDGTQQQYVNHALALLKTMAQDLAGRQPSLPQLRLLAHKAGRLLSHATKTSEAELIAQIKAAQRHLETAMGRRETATEHQTNITITRRSLEIDHAHQQTALARIATDIQRLNQELAEVAERRQAQPAGHKTITAAEATVAKLKTQLDDMRAMLAGPAAVVNTTAIAEAAGRLERLRGQQAAAQTRLQAIAVEQSAPLSTPELTELQAEIQRLTGEIAARTTQAQDMAAEHAEVSTRSADLSAQITDLEQAQADLQELIDRLGGLIQSRFRENFATLAQQFSHYFTQLFGGGSASLELTEAEDGTYGIAIKATPKGKRLSNLSVLSGGERALTGVALLAAILSVNPSPFVVLDEIDAALDEANSGRLATILEELAAKSQLIVITHNRQTMTAAKVLFGVTMNEHHVSHLLSLRLEQARELAAR